MKEELNRFPCSSTTDRDHSSKTEKQNLDNGFKSQNSLEQNSPKTYFCTYIRTCKEIYEAVSTTNNINESTIQLLFFK